MTFKRWLTILLCGVLCAILSTAVSADTESMQTVNKIYTLNMTETQGSITASPATPAFWEYPILSAGEDFVEGTMVIKNASDYTASMSLTSVSLPYGDTAKLTYLNQLMITVCEEDEVLFDGTYAHINDPSGGLSIKLDNMAPGEEHVYTVKMRCLYTYAGDPYTDAAQLTWNFAASGETTVFEESQGLPQWAMILVIGFAATIAALIVVMIVRAVITRKKKTE